MRVRAHFNPAVFFADAAFGGLSWRDAAAYLPARIVERRAARVR